MSDGFHVAPKTIRIGRLSVLALSVLAIAFAFAEGQAQQNDSSCPTDVTCAEQGWLPDDREVFYTTSQGSHMMPYAWFKALRRLDADEPFAADALQRYGYLPNKVSTRNPEGLPVGFVIDGGDPASGQLGMTCAACHTGQLEYVSKGVTHALRIDGAPANADFQQFLLDLLAASKATLTEPDRFDAFEKAVLGESSTAAKAEEIKAAFGVWVAQFEDFMNESLPKAIQWGPGRLDAFGMIFNRVTARDLEVHGNFRLAEAPVSYPFLWNASRQDRTQWNGGVPNGHYIQALGRNSGEVFGVFADFKPRRHQLLPGVDYSESSANLGGLQTLEEKIVKLRPPPWPAETFGFNKDLAEVGAKLFHYNCSECHSIPSAVSRAPWPTPVRAVGTDPKMVLNSARTADPGRLSGTPLPPPAIGLFADSAKASDILAAAVVGSLTDAFFQASLSPATLTQNGVFRALSKDFTEHFRGEDLRALFDLQLFGARKREAKEKVREFITGQLSDMFNPPRAPGPAYESRVLRGIWATAPYLHNGSVPNLWELLKPPAERTTSFMVGSRVFDPINVGYDTGHSPFKNGLFVVDPANANGNGNGGHKYGSDLTEEERWAIVEYLKTL